jgi:hypothetical protein
MSTNKKRGCVYWIRRCFISDETDIGNDQIENDVIVVNNNRQENNQDDLKLKIQSIDEKFIIETKIERNTIQFSEAYDDKTTFNCPICLKYYNQILILQCCNNYICIYCAEDYKTTQIKYDFNIKCPICGFDKVIKLLDVDENHPNKVYSDSPIIKRVVKVEIKSSSSVINLQEA